jgi:hypothetical protein
VHVQELPEDNGPDPGNVSNTISHDHHIHLAVDTVISSRYVYKSYVRSFA